MHVTKVLFPVAGWSHTEGRPKELIHMTKQYEFPSAITVYDSEADEFVAEVDFLARRFGVSIESPWARLERQAARVIAAERRVYHSIASAR